MLSNIKLGPKLIGGFLVVSLIALTIGVFGYFQIHKLNDDDTFLYEKCTVSLGQMANVTVGFERLSANMSFIVLEKNLNPEYLKAVDQDIKQVDDALKGYQKTLI